MSKKFVGALFIVAGTSIGATTLALPLTLSFGFWPNIMLLFAIWLVAFQSSLVNIEISKIYPNILCISKLCKKVFANKLFLVADFAIIVLFSSLICAYISGMHTVISINLDLSPLKALFFAIALMLALIAIIASKIEILDISNKVIFYIKLIVFFFLVISIFLSHQNAILPIAASEQIQPRFFIIAVPIIFTAFGFHGCIPVIIRYLEADHKLVKKTFFFGSLTSLLIYIVWILAISGIMPIQGDGSLAQIKQANNPLADFITTISNSVKFENFRLFLELFSFLAIITSLFGVGVGLYNYYLDRYFAQKRFGKLYAICSTFLPSIITVIINANIFYQALAFAAIFLCLIAIILPNIINIKVNYLKMSLGRSIILLAAGTIIIIFESINLFNNT